MHKNQLDFEGLLAAIERLENILRSCFHSYVINV
jgi:hypothetical protein